MKKNEHYFPTIEYIKDPTEELGWKKIIHECNEGGAREEIACDEIEIEAPDNTEPGHPESKGQA